jgi:methylthioribose-1-phosphate isomerase
MQSYSPIIWKDDSLYLLDQRLLPTEEKFVRIDSLDGVIEAIRDMVVRGAPCIGFSAIFGLALWIKNRKDIDLDSSREACNKMISARPTAVNLSFEVNRCFDLLQKSISEKKDLKAIYALIVSFGHEQIKLSQVKNMKMAELGISELKSKLGERKWNLMTHCNTGFLACGSLGTALGVISVAHSHGLVSHVYADETRPYMQGTRLTAFELTKENIPFSLVVEGAASYLMSNKMVDAIFVGADRIAANGDTANKVGTSTLAIVAKNYGVPFYVVAPLSSFDANIKDGSHIEIEMRATNELTHIKGIQLAPEGAKSINPSFDVTDHRFITGIICEKGFINPAIQGELLRIIES